MWLKPFVSSVFMTSIFILSTPSCTGGARKIASKTVVKINDRQMTSKEFSVLLARRLKDLDAIAAKDSENVRKAKEAIINDFIVRSLILDWAKAKEIKITEKEVDEETIKLRAQYPDDLSFRRLLAEENMSFSDWREKIQYNLIERRFFAEIQKNIVPAKEEEIKKAYESRRADFRQKERIYLRQILVSDQARAELIKNELKNKSFSDLAQKYSMAPEAKSGGIVGWIEKGDVDFFDQLFTLPVGAVSKIFSSSFGFHIAKVEKKIPAGFKSFDEMRPSLIREFIAKKEQAEFVMWLDGQIRSSKVYKDLDLINKIDVETQVSTD